MTAEGVAAEAAASPLAASSRLRLLLSAGLLLLLLTLAAPQGSLIGIPVIFFLKNRLHLSASGTAQFNLWVSVPLYLSFAPGMLRDRWSPFGLGDRGHLVLFGLATAAAFVTIAFLTPSYAVLMGGLFVSTTTALVALSAANGIFSAMGRAHLMPGQASSVLLIASWIPTIAGSLLGGSLSQALEGLNGPAAAQALFLAGAALLALAALLAVLGPRALYASHDTARRHSLGGDIGRLLRSWPVWPVLLLNLLWNFQPTYGTALTYHLSNHLHASDSQVGGAFALFWVGSMVMALLYSQVCQRVRLRPLLWFGTILGIPSMLPLLIVQTPNQALLAAIFVGLMSGFGSAALIDLTIRASPKGLEGTMMMLILSTTFYVSGRLGDVWGTWIYDQKGGFTVVVVVTTLVYALLPFGLLLVPRRLTATADGQAGPA